MPNAKSQNANRFDDRQFSKFINLANKLIKNLIGLIILINMESSKAIHDLCSIKLIRQRIKLTITMILTLSLKNIKYSTRFSSALIFNMSTLKSELRFFYLRIHYFRILLLLKCRLYWWFYLNLKSVAEYIINKLSHLIIIFSSYFYYRVPQKVKISELWQRSVRYQ